jgi:hypothetical protein
MARELKSKTAENSFIKTFNTIGLTMLPQPLSPTETS